MRVFRSVSGGAACSLCREYDTGVFSVGGCLNTGVPQRRHGRLVRLSQDGPLQDGLRGRSLTRHYGSDSDLTPARAPQRSVLSSSGACPVP